MLNDLKMQEEFCINDMVQLYEVYDDDDDEEEEEEDDGVLLLFNAVYIQANLEDDIVKEALKTVSYYSGQEHIN